MDQVAIAAMEREIRGAMGDLANEEMVLLKEEEALYKELEQAEDQQQDFGNTQNAQNWNRFEVAHWIDVEVKLNEYMTSFMKAHVDGSILLNDLGRDYLVMELGVKRVHIEKIMRAITELRDAVRTEWDESECIDIIPYLIMNDPRATDKIEELQGEISKRDEELENLKREYDARIAKLCKTIEEKEAVISQATEQGFVFGDDDKDDDDMDVSDSASVTDDDMPPLIEAHQQTVMIQEHDIMTSQILESNNTAEQAQVNGIENGTNEIDDANQTNENETNETNQTDDIDENNEETKDEEAFEIVNKDDATENKSREERSGSVVLAENEVNGLPVDVMQPPQQQQSGGDVVDKIMSKSPSPNLTPSASQMNLQQTKSTGKKRKHHRKNSTKANFWAGAGGPKKKPPVATKAYWMYLDKKHDTNQNFANPLRVQNWHHHEIAWWLKSIKCEKYAKKFVEEKVSGEQLIYDMQTDVLSTDLDVKMLHCGKLMREIKSLKIQAGLQYVVEENVNKWSFRPSNEESVMKQMEELENKLREGDEKHEEELKEKQAQYEELAQENEKLKKEVEGLEKQVVELEKRKAKPVDSDDDSDEDEDYDEPQKQEVMAPPTPTATVTEDTKQDGDDNNEANEDGDGNGDINGDGDNENVDENKDDATTLNLPTDKIVVKEPKESTSGKRPKGYFRKYPKEIRKLMRSIDEMVRKSNEGEYGQHNKGKFGATNRAFKWKTHEVCYWLDKRGFVSYIKPFYDNGIDGEILVNDLNPTILHEDLDVKRFHTGKMLREIQVLRQGGLYTESDFVIDIGYEIQFSASQRIEQLTQENEEMTAKMKESEEKVEELISRPQIEEHQKIVEIAEWDELNAEKERLAKQIDTMEQKIEEVKLNAVPEQEMAEAKEKLLQYIEELKQKKEEDESFGDVIKVRKWNTEEVCWFFSSIGLGDYINGVRDAQINGEILIEDTNAEMLSSDIGVKRIHINQILRQVEDLRHKAFGYEPDENIIDISFIPEVYATELNENYEKKIDDLENDIKQQEEKYSELTNNFEQLTKDKEDLNTEKNGLLENIDNLNKNIQDLKDQQRQEMEDSAKQQIEELNGTIQELNKTINDNKESYDEEKKTMEEANAQVLEEKETNITELNGKIEEITNNLNEANLKIEEYMDKEEMARKAEEAKDNSYEAQLRRMAEDDATFAVPKRAHKWSVEEVSHWLYTIKIPDYVDAFKEKLVDGSILLSDLSDDQLRTELGIKNYHIGRINREIAKLKELATPPLAESDFVVDQGYIPEKTAVETVTELNRELTDQKDINSALSIELERANQQLLTLKEIQAMGAEEMQQTKGGPNDPELKEELEEVNNNENKPNVSGSSNINNEEFEKLTKENQELNQILEDLQKSKIDLAMRTASEMQKLRAMVRVASKAYEELTGTPLGQVAQWPSTQNFFYNTLGYSPTKNNNNHNNYNGNNHYR